MSKRPYYTPASAVMEGADRLQRTADFLLYGHDLDMDEELNEVEAQELLFLICAIQQVGHQTKKFALQLKGKDV
jgi:hypothetical protein